MAVLRKEAASAPASEVLDPRNTWADKDAYDATARDLAARFRTNDANYLITDEVRAAGPQGD